MQAAHRRGLKPLDATPAALSPRSLGDAACARGAAVGVMYKTTDGVCTGEQEEVCADEEGRAAARFPLLEFEY